MITKQKYGNVNNVTIIQFGLGTIAVAMGKNENHTSILFKSDCFLEIGSDRPFVGNSDEFEPEVVMTFISKDSIDVVIDALKLAKKDLNK